MGTHRFSIFGPMQGVPSRKATGSVRLAPSVRNDVFLNALLEMPTTQQSRRSPLEWLGAMGLHIAIVAALIVVPLYTTGTIRLSGFRANPVGSSSATDGAAPRACGRPGGSAYSAAKGKVELCATETDGAHRDSEEDFVRLGQRCRSSS